VKDWEECVISSESQVLNMQIESEWFTAANGSQWRLTMCSTQEKQHLSVFLEARTTVNHFPQDAHHTISVQILKANGKLEKILNKTSKDTFTSENFMIGYPKSILLSRIAMVNDKSLFVTSTVRASTSKEISKKITGYVGLINEGTTCYMNSLLQTLFMITSFRQAIYKIPFSDSEECRIPKALGKLFAALQTNPKSLSTQDLLKSFGWGRDQWHEQQDVQEFLYKFSDTMEKSMFGTPAEGIYSELFKGSIVQKIKCIEVDYCSESIEEFMDLQLDVKGCGNIYTSLDKYVEPVLLKGEIQYDAMNFGKQDAVKVVKFKKLPSVLQIQLKRFEYNQNRGMMMKVNERFEFYPIIDLNKYTEDMGTKDVFQLFSITVHSGTLGKGHYSSFISPQLDNCWFKFNDEMVDLALPCQAIEANWGGDFEDIGLGEGGRVIPLKKKSDISAYMLVYIRISDSSSVLPQMSSSCIPAQLLITEKPLELIKRDKKRNCKNTFIIALASKETLTGWEGAGVAGWHSKYLFFIRISKTQETIGNYFRNQMQMFTEYKLWTFTPGPSNWNFVEVNLNDPLSTCAFTAEGSRCLFVESTHKVFTGGPENWTWNELETLPESEKHDFSKTFVFIKKFENGNTRILGCEWLRENCYTIEVLKELKENVFKKVFDSRCDAWACIESSKSDSPFVREAYCFRSLEKNWKIFTGDVFIFGEDVVDAPTLLMQTYNKIEIELIFHDKENYSEQKSYSKDLLEKHSFKTQFKISADLSSPLFILMKEIHSSLNLP
jgi:ubiquitin C-terminal hydrolase